MDSTRAATKPPSISSRSDFFISLRALGTKNPMKTTLKLKLAITIWSVSFLLLVPRLLSFLIFLSFLALASGASVFFIGLSSAYRVLVHLNEGVGPLRKPVLIVETCSYLWLFAQPLVLSIACGRLYPLILVPVSLVFNGLVADVSTSVYRIGRNYMIKMRRIRDQPPAAVFNLGSSDEDVEGTERKTSATLIGRKEARGLRRVKRSRGGGSELRKSRS